MDMEMDEFYQTLTAGKSIPHQNNLAIWIWSYKKCLGPIIQ